MILTRENMINYNCAYANHKNTAFSIILLYYENNKAEATNMKLRIWKLLDQMHIVHI